MANPGMWQSPERLYVDRAPTDPNARVVPEDSPQAAFVLVGENGEIPMALAERLGLTGEAKSRAKDADEVESTGVVLSTAEPTTEPVAESSTITAGTNRSDRAEVIQMGGEAPSDEEAEKSAKKSGGK